MNTGTMTETLYLLNKKNGYQGCVISTINNGRVCFSGSLYNNNGQDFTVEEYAKHRNIEPLVLNWTELEKLIKEYHNQQYLSKNWTEITEERFYDMFECLPPMNYSHTSECMFFFCSEAQTADIHSAFIAFNGKYYTADRSRFQKTEELINELKKQLN